MELTIGTEGKATPPPPHELLSKMRIDGALAERLLYS